MHSLHGSIFNCIITFLLTCNIQLINPSYAKGGRGVKSTQLKFFHDNYGYSISFVNKIFANIISIMTG